MKFRALCECRKLTSSEKINLGYGFGLDFQLKDVSLHSVRTACICYRSVSSLDCCEEVGHDVCFCLLSS